MAWTVATAPSDEPLTLDEVKRHLRVSAAREDDLISSLISASRQHVERTCNRALMPQEWRLVLDGFDRGEIILTGGPFRGIQSIDYYDAGGAEQTLSTQDYRAVLSEPARIQPVDHWPATQPRIDAVTILADVGYEDADQVPAPLKQAMLLLITHWYEHRSAVNVGNIATALPASFEALVFPFRDGGTL